MSGRVILVRHGQTPASVERRFAGSSDVELTQEGHAQARMLASRLSKVSVDELVVSPLVRCRQTAAPIAEALGVEPVTVDALRECDFGAWEGLTSAEVREAYPDHFDRWIGDESVQPPDGESWAEVYERCDAWWDEVTAAAEGRTVLAVTHGGVVLTVLRRALGAPYVALIAFEIDPCSVTMVSSRGRLWRVRLVNDTTHLRDPLLDGPPPVPMPP